MTQPPPDLAAYEAEVRRRVEASNYAPAGGHPASVGAVKPHANAPTDAERALGEALRRKRRVPVVVTLALVSSALASVGILAYYLGPIIFKQSDEGSAREVELALKVGPPYASELNAGQMYDAYIAMNRNGSIYEIIPNTDDGRRYFRAFMYSVTDVKVAEKISGKMTAEQAKQLAEREKHFLALEDLDIDIDITHTDGTRELLNGLPPKGV